MPGIGYIRVLASVAITLWLAASTGSGHAHLFQGDSVAFFVNSAEVDPDAPDDQMLLVLHFSNGSGNAATLRGLWVAGHGAVDIEKLRDFLVFRSWQEVKFLRLEPGAELTLAPPAFKVAVPATAWSSEDFKIVADFGPLGRIEPQQLSIFPDSDDAVRQ